LHNYDQVYNELFCFTFFENNFQFIFQDEMHELLPSELGSKAPAIVIHTCDDLEEQKNKDFKPMLVQTKRPHERDLN